MHASTLTLLTINDITQYREFSKVLVFELKFSLGVIIVNNEQLFACEKIQMMYHVVHRMLQMKK